MCVCVCVCVALSLMVSMAQQLFSPKALKFFTDEKALAFSDYREFKSKSNSISIGTLVTATRDAIETTLSHTHTYKKLFWLIIQIIFWLVKT